MPKIVAAGVTLAVFIVLFVRSDDGGIETSVLAGSVSLVVGLVVYVLLREPATTASDPSGVDIDYPAGVDIDNHDGREGPFDPAA